MTIERTTLRVKSIQNCILVIFSILVSWNLAEGSGPVDGMDVSGTVQTDALTLFGLDCTVNANGGTLTTNASGEVICSDDDASGATGSPGADGATGATGPPGADGAPGPATVTILVECSGAGLVLCTCPVSHPFLMGGACERGSCSGGGFGASTSFSGSPPDTYSCVSIGKICPVVLDIICSS